MKVHILTHTVVDDADPAEFYSMVAEHLEKLKELGVVEAVAVHHGDLPEGGLFSTPSGDDAGGLLAMAADAIRTARALSS